MRVGLYTRVSTLEQANEGYSLGEQESKLKSYCDARGWTVAKVYKDGGFSGGDTDRPALKRMIQDIKNKNIDTVIVYKLDRLSRSQKDTLNLIEDVFIANDVNFISINENFDTSTPFGKAMIGILSVFAQLEREQIKERMSMGLEGRAKKGLYRGGANKPLGYDYIDGLLVINEYEAMIVEEIFDLYLNGYSTRKLSGLLEEKYPNVRKWANPSIPAKILKNELYYGAIEHKGEIYKGLHEAIIDKETFDKAQRRLNDNGKRSDKTTPYMATKLLTGIIWCGGCGARYCNHSTKINYKGVVSRYNYYKCYSKLPKSTMVVDPNCKNKNWKLEVVDNLVINEILKLQFDKGYLEQLTDKGKNEDNTEDKIDVIKKRINELSNQLDKVMDMYQLGGISLDKLTKRVKDLNTEKENLEHKLYELEVGNGNKKHNEDKITEALSNAKEVLEGDDMLTKRMLVQSLIERITLYNDHIDIKWNF